MSHRHDPRNGCRMTLARPHRSAWIDLQQEIPLQTRRVPDDIDQPIPRRQEWEGEKALLRTTYGRPVQSRRVPMAVLTVRLDQGESCHSLLQRNWCRAQTTSRRYGLQRRSTVTEIDRHVSPFAILPVSCSNNNCVPRKIFGEAQL